MSEGKVTLTPERIEEIRQAHANGVSRGERTLSIGLESLEGLLAALEESQQQVEESKIREIDLEEQYKTLYRMYTDMDKSCGETLDLLKETSCSLAKAQQTIATAKRIFEMADAETDFDDVLHGMYEVLGRNKEGRDKA